MKKLRVGVLFGGRSGEHEVSLLSAASVLKAINRKKYEIVPIGITKGGRWVTSSDAERLLGGDSGTLPASTERNLRAGDPETTSAAAVLARGESVIVPPVPSDGKTGTLVPFETEAKGLELRANAASGPVLNLDVIFPVLHGTFGEDGTIQGLFELAGIAYVGSGVLGSAAGMDKDVMKRLFAAAKLPIPRHVSFLRAEWESGAKKIIAKIEGALKYPLFVKPANLGSSVGITKVHNRKELAPAIDTAAGFDRKIVVEQGVGGKKGKARELEVAVLGNDRPEASVVGEIVPGKEFYDYEAKYLSEGSYPIIPAKITKQQSKTIREMAIAAFQACDCSGLARVDFLMDPASNSSRAPRIYLNEINTLPGFTSISMYPKLWAASGVAYPDLIDRLIALALERRAEKDRTNYSR
ncbi:D-alanine-D-alanine ligase [Silvibacterium bohemicum]|uniref:D-alanine--D-alanine ligase n=1 Tax=Silvibacterium bohemicum TaxID=1577686 RepID=A0A841JXT0_9BACT|nr:D-alanine--D-alanine ligase family protein [Silvibacterium bohemicum]MBB6146152.1 D-alanine-D-alanine ligase [Silvibacterium bohemicum]